MGPSGPIYPGAITTRWHGDAWPGRAINPDRGVLHTTEGHGLPGYRAGADHPHFTALPRMEEKRLVWYQHQSLYRSARTLMNLPGGVETNAENAIQVELQGTSGWASPKNKRRPYTVGPDWSEAEDWMLEQLGAWMRWLNQTVGIPLVAPYPLGDWRGTGRRMTAAQWRSFTGWCGHSQVPENDHSDPGALDIQRALSYAKGASPAPIITPVKEEEMELVSSSYANQQEIKTGGKEQPLGVVPKGVWNFHSKPGPFIASVNGWLKSTTPAQVVIVADNDSKGTRRWIDRAPLIPGAPAFSITAIGELAKGECLRIIGINHSDKPQLVGNLVAAVMS